MFAAFMRFKSMHLIGYLRARVGVYYRFWYFDHWLSSRSPELKIKETLPLILQIARIPGKN